MPRRLLVLIVLALAGWPAPLAGGQPLELQVKAAFLYNFARFVEWPPDAFETPRQPLTICVLGRDPFGRILDAVVAGEDIRGRPLAVRRLTAPPKDRTCQILFVASSERDRFRNVLNVVDSKRTLTVSDDWAFLDADGHIALFVEENRVRFAVNTEATAGCDFQMSSRLLQVARPYPARPETEH